MLKPFSGCARSPVQFIPVARHRVIPVPSIPAPQARCRRAGQWRVARTEKAEIAAAIRAKRTQRTAGKARALIAEPVIVNPASTRARANRQHACA